MKLNLFRKNIEKKEKRLKKTKKHLIKIQYFLKITKISNNIIIHSYIYFAYFLNITKI